MRALLAQLAATPGFHVENRMQDFHVSDDLAAAHGVYTIAGTGGAPDITGKWAAVSQRQADGLWKVV